MKKLSQRKVVRYTNIENTKQENPLTLSNKKKKKEKLIFDDEDMDEPMENNKEKSSLVDIIPDNHTLLV
jgi:hypothetical protein